LDDLVQLKTSLLEVQAGLLKMRENYKEEFLKEIDQICYFSINRLTHLENKLK